MTTALYRRYRPDTFADVIGQEHVTEPLMTALRKNRVNHAYLFSGPRGCGKTTSARILARCLNCAQGPTDTPCGTCDSCVELARGGSGSLDVIEIDAASHGGVDDARDLRERATFAPVRDRYKIFIIDEAHMVTSAGFNALLKIVEEPPEHIKFIFATTEPDKVIGTIRSRTHHYPFRLVPPEPLMAYLNLLCEQEHVPVAPGVLSLVVRAGGGSVRDSLSVLDQLMAGAGEQGLDYELAVSLLGYTHTSLLDDVVDALAAADAGTVFRAVDRVIQTGLDPRRFVEDLLERFRDLIIVQAMPESAQIILRGMPEDQIARMQTQSTQLGRAELSRAADVTNNALTEMTGATSPRLHLELLCARLLLPGADQTERGITARVDRIERRLSYTTPAADVAIPTSAPENANNAAASSAATQPAANRPATSSPVASRPVTTRPTASGEPATAPAAQMAPPTDAEASQQSSAGRQSPTEGQDAPQASESPAPTPAAQTSSALDDWGLPVISSRPQETAARMASNNSRPSTEPPANFPASPSVAPDQPIASPNGISAETGSQVSAAQQPERVAATPPSSANANSAAAGIDMLRRAWPDVLDQLTKIKRSSWALIAPNATPQSFDGQTLQLNFSTDGLASAFARGEHAENLRAAIKATLGVDCRIEAGSGGPAGNNDPRGAAPNPKDLTEPAADTAGSQPAPENPREQVWQRPVQQAPVETYPDVEPPLPEDEPNQANWQGQPNQQSAEPASAWSTPVQSNQPTRTKPSSAEAAPLRSARPATVAEPGWGDLNEAPDWISGGEEPSAPTTSELKSEPTSPEPQEEGHTSLYQRLTRQAKIAQHAEVAEPEPAKPYIEDIPSADDETIEESGLVGQAAVERILGGRLVEERRTTSRGE